MFSRIFSKEMRLLFCANKFPYWLHNAKAKSSDYIWKIWKLAFLKVTVCHVLYFSLRFEQGYCYFGAKCTFAHGREELEGWRELYERQVENLAQLQEKRLLTQSFSEKVLQRIQSEGRGVVSKIAFI